MSKVDYLTDDTTLLPADQKFVCISFLTDKENKSSLSGIKIRGTYSTYEAACEQAKKLQSIDQYFNVFFNIYHLLNGSDKPIGEGEVGKNCSKKTRYF
jgi:hypothetical protein